MEGEECGSVPSYTTLPLSSQRTPLVVPQMISSASGTPFCCRKLALALTVSIYASATYTPKVRQGPKGQDPMLTARRASYCRAIPGVISRTVMRLRMLSLLPFFCRGTLCRDLGLRSLLGAKDDAYPNFKMRLERSSAWRSIAALSEVVPAFKILRETQILSSNRGAKLSQEQCKAVGMVWHLDVK